MLGILEGIEEYSNAGALIGIEGIEDGELLGALKRMNPIKRERTVNKLANTGSPSRGSRAEMEKHFGELPPHIKEGLANGTLRLADQTVYSIKPVTSKTISPIHARFVIHPSMFLRIFLGVVRYSHRHVAFMRIWWIG